MYENEINILLVDDQQIVISGIVAGLKNRPNIKVIGRASTGVEAIRMAGELHPDIIIMDIGMPVMNGLECTKIIAQSYPDIKILIYTIIENKDTLINAYRVGATGYVPKDTPLEEFFDIIEQIYYKKVLAETNV
jgi:two-component system, NarL family, nitrate/nitrite response regulator NarL